jgi:hypothetical protein
MRSIEVHSGLPNRDTARGRSDYPRLAFVRHTDRGEKSDSGCKVVATTTLT